MHCTWLECIRSYRKIQVFGSFASRWLFHSQFHRFKQSIRNLVYYLLIERMTGLCHQDVFPIMIVLLCMVTYWIEPMMSHDLRLSSNHDFTKLLHCIISQPWDNIEFVLKLVVILTYAWDCKLIIYSLWIGSLLIKASSNRYSQ